MKHKAIIEKFIREQAKKNGHTFIKINWNKRQLHYLTKTGNKMVESLTIPRIIEQKDEERDMAEGPQEENREEEADKRGERGSE